MIGLAVSVLGPNLSRAQDGSDTLQNSDTTQGHDPLQSEAAVFGSQPRPANEEPTPWSARAEVAVPIAATHESDPTASGTAVPIPSRVAPGESLQDVLRDVPGARPLARGGLGSFSSLTLRGAESAHTSVLIDTVPLSGPDRGPFDLSLTPLHGLERVEVYRGGAPIWWSDGAIGGVLRLVPRGQRTAYGRRVSGALSLAAGSFGRFDTQAHISVESPSVALFATASLRRAENDYSYLDDGGTRFVPDDDRERRRLNADATASDQLLSLKLAVGPGELGVLWLSGSRRQGEPGPAAAPAAAARRQLYRGLAALSYSLSGGSERPWQVHTSISAALEQNAVDDRFAQIGNSPELTRDRTLTVFARTAAEVQLLDWFRLSAIASGRIDRYLPRDRLEPTLDTSSSRTTAAAAVEGQFFGNVGSTRFQVRPSIRLAHSSGRITSNVLGSEGTDFRKDTFPTARLGFLVSPLPWLTFAASGATGGRLPSLLEVFGNRVTLLPNPALNRERSLSFDAGVTAKPQFGALRLTLEARGFWLEVDDLIRYRRTSQFTAIAENIEQGRIRGFESGIDLAFDRWVVVRGTFTVTDAQAESGRRLPLRPILLASMRAELHSGALGSEVDDLVGFAAWSHTGANYLDPANLIELPGRNWWSLGVAARLFSKRLRLSFVVRDLFDQRGSDLLGFPLPGRRFFAEASFAF